MEWISVSDRLPESTEIVLVYKKQEPVSYITTAVYYKHFKAFRDERTGFGLTGIEYWMPLPKPQKENA